MNLQPALRAKGDSSHFEAFIFQKNYIGKSTGKHWISCINMTPRQFIVPRESVFE